MARPDTIIIDGRVHSWRQLCELRRQQLEASRKAEGTQTALFELHEDNRPPGERTAALRYTEPGLLDWQRHGTDGGSRG
jgi:hypothetical protein